MKKYINLVILILLLNNLSAQTVSGYIKARNDEKVKTYKFLPGAKIFWASSTESTVSDKNGYFEIAKKEGDNIIIVSLTAYQNDTIKYY